MKQHRVTEALICILPGDADKIKDSELTRLMQTQKIQVLALLPTGAVLDQTFDAPFRIGRTDECEICIKNEYVSRVHAEVVPNGDGWHLRDLNSSNGVFINGERVAEAVLQGTTEIRLGVEGPLLRLAVEAPPVPPVNDEKAKVEEIISHYFADGKNDEPAGEHTMFVRKAFSQVQSKQKRKYSWLVAGLAACILAASVFAWYEHRQMSKQKATAEDLFYAMKSLDVDIANLERVAFRSSDQAAKAEVRRFESRRGEEQKSYDNFLASLKVYDPKMTPQRRLILRVARIFGECELTMPPEFADEIDRYIKQWQSTDRLKRAIVLAKQNGYAPVISQALLAQDLPPQYFYLALQESDFDPYVSGPVTYKGIAKGMWQFIPETAVKYGLHIGPLVDVRRRDPADDRHHYDKETVAAAAYLKDLFTSDAQASGLLVMACYNWGEGRVLPLVRSMPDNPRQRNFWQLLTRYKDQVPKETYDYVFNIVSAAVIGEDPKLFGFDFENPLADAESH